MEKYSSSCRLILCCNSSSKVTEAIKSRCPNVRINALSQEQKVCNYPHGFASRIAEKSNRSLRRAILSLETCRVQNYPFTDNQVISPMDWEEYVAEIATDMLREQSPQSLFQVRGKVYELLVNCIPPEVILKFSNKTQIYCTHRLLHELLRKLDSELKLEVCHRAAYYEHQMRLGQKAIFHIEGI
ncbi:Replication factor C subunit 3 [Raphanus sativus]|nr:Replication factor C subunit 3 [Raphanus sativus]